MTFDVVALGELLIDFTSCGLSEQNNIIFEANPGGAPGNVLAMLAKLGRKTAFIGKVGSDMFGSILVDSLQKSGINESGVIVEKNANTTLAFVQNSPEGDRKFSFFRNPGADTLLTEEDVNAHLVQNCKIFHFGSLSLTHEPARTATKRAVEIAKSAGAKISFDPNLRPPLWDTLEEAKSQIEWGCSVCDILKIADDELRFLLGGDNLQKSVQILREKYPNLKLILLTKGRHGAEGFWREYRFSHPSFMEVKTIDTTGAGDTFMGCCLSYLLDLSLDNPEQKSLEEMIVFANAAASLITTKKGAMLSMPNKDEILALIESSINNATV